MHKLLTGSLSVETVTVEIAGLPETLQNTRIVQLSDFHYDGHRLSDEMLAEAIALCNAQQPDLVALTGDYVTDDPEPVHGLVSQLKQLESRAGVYAILGNHEYYVSDADVEITQALITAGIRVLLNEIVYPLGDGFAIVGLADFWSPAFDPASVMEQLDPSTPRLVLSHNPDSASILQRWRVDLQLSGHTHGGQIVLPGLGPIAAVGRKMGLKVPKVLRRRSPYYQQECYKVVRNWEWAQGLHQVGQNTLYVNRGLGTYFPGRLFCPPEVTVITLVGR